MQYTMRVIVKIDLNKSMKVMQYLGIRYMNIGI